MKKGAFFIAIFFAFFLNTTKSQSNRPCPLVHVYTPDTVLEAHVYMAVHTAMVSIPTPLNPHIMQVQSQGDAPGCQLPSWSWWSSVQSMGGSRGKCWLVSNDGWGVCAEWGIAIFPLKLRWIHMAISFMTLYKSPRHPPTQDTLNSTVPWREYDAIQSYLGGG